MLERYDWKKEEKIYYLSSKEPKLITFPAFKYFSLSGQGNPNDEFFCSLYTMPVFFILRSQDALEKRNWFRL